MSKAVIKPQNVPFGKMNSVSRMYCWTITLRRAPMASRIKVVETVKDAVAAAKELSFTLYEISRSRRWGRDWERPVVVNIRKNCYNENKETGMREQNSISKITLDPYICGGKPCIRDTRIEIAVILDGLAEGLSESDLIDHYPQLSKDDIHAALAYAAELAHESVWKPAVSA